jgi:hypothetical protein
MRICEIREGVSHEAEQEERGANVRCGVRRNAKHYPGCAERVGEISLIANLP